MIERRLGPAVLDLFLGDLEAGAFVLDCVEGDLLTSDVRDFGVVAREAPVALVPRADADRHGRRRTPPSASRPELDEERPGTNSWENSPGLTS